MRTVKLKLPQSLNGENEDENSDVCFTITANNNWFKPLPPKQELIDGKAYQFDYLNKTFDAYYKKHTNRFFYIDGFISADVVTNITLLTPEGK